MRGTEKRLEKLKASSHFINEKKRFFSLTVHQELIYCPNQEKLQKKKDQKLLQGTKREENQKGTKKSKKSKSSMNSAGKLNSVHEMNSGRRHGSFAT